ncbi:patatin-like phospholipase family protein [Kutzneria buriramensis]|uniref:NTE family protein n=1 Tax=Kutzneria buriramensis TaxID=1045776 RepID=A0A3E0HDX4_9PSEU|nr:patatin-like phospholipase family protein [Kutzneria buriramensis]REH43474.1 NTE family protein [Kutzneria buriramensis]
MNALVLGGGGPVGAAWTAALLHGLVSAGLPLAESDVVLGTSAGSLVGAWLTMRPGDLATVPDRMRRRAAWHAGNAKSGHGDRSLMGRALAKTEPAVSIAKAAAQAFPPISAEQAQAMWQADLPDDPWPPSLRVASVNGGTGLAHLWSAADGIPLAVAVASSTAAPGVAPPVALGDEFWVDGGVRSGTNADLIDVPGNVLVATALAGDDLAREEAVLVERGHSVRIVTPTPFFRVVTDLLDPGLIDAAAAVGASQAADIAADMGKWWQYSD